MLGRARCTGDWTRWRTTCASRCGSSGAPPGSRSPPARAGLRDWRNGHRLHAGRRGRAAAAARGGAGGTGLAAGSVVLLPHLRADPRSRRTCSGACSRGSRATLHAEWTSEPEPTSMVLVTGAFHDTLGLQPAAGRLLNQADVGNTRGRGAGRGGAELYRLAAALRRGSARRSAARFASKGSRSPSSASPRQASSGSPSGCRRT